MTTTYWYPISGSKQLQYEISGPTSFRMFSRIEFGNTESKQDYYIRIREDGYDLGSYYLKTELSDKSFISKTRNSVGKWRSIWINVPEGKHHYTITLPAINDNQNKSIFIRCKKWQEEQ